MAQMTVITGRDRRRRWDGAERERILDLAFAPGAVVAEVARRFDVATSLVYKWRRQSQSAMKQTFAPALLIEEAGVASRCEPIEAAPAASPIRVELSGGSRVTIEASAPTALVEAVLRALR